MQTQSAAATTAAETSPEAVRFAVNGLSFAIDISALTPGGQRKLQRHATEGGIYEPVMTRCLARLLSQMPEPRFMDIGSFVGYYACYVATLLGPGAPVSAIEANPKFCEATRRSCELNGLPNVSIYEAALSDAPEAVAIDDRAVVSGGLGVQKTATTLDQLCENDGVVWPNIIKMDIHGSEGKALRGMRTALQRMDYLLLELHGEMRIEPLSGGMRRSDVLQFLWDSKLLVYYMAGHRAPHPCLNDGRFVYRQVTPANAECVFFDRPFDSFLLVTARDDLEAALGESVKDRYYCY